MKIIKITTEPLSLPLRRPFITAYRTVEKLENILVKLHTDTGETGYGEAPAVTAVTGEASASITEAIHHYIAPLITDMDVRDIYMISARIQSALYGNPAAKSAVESAVYDIWGQYQRAPLYQLLNRAPIKENRPHAIIENNDLTISAGDTESMTADALQAVKNGHSILKIKLGKNACTDGLTLLSLWAALKERWPYTGLKFRVDANQGWTVKEALRIIHAWESQGVPLDWIEQPVAAGDIAGLKTVTDSTDIDIVADEAVFSARDAVKVLERRAADMINIKLGKAGGPGNALKIADLCEIYQVKCVIGCMLESRLGAAAAAHIAYAHPNIVKIDLDGPLLCAEDFFVQGPIFNGAHIDMTQDLGWGLNPK